MRECLGCICSLLQSFLHLARVSLTPGVHSLLEVVVAWSISILTLAASLAGMSYTDPTACSHRQTSISSPRTPQDMVGQHYRILKSQSFAQSGDFARSERSARPLKEIVTNSMAECPHLFCRALTITYIFMFGQSCQVCDSYSL